MYPVNNFTVVESIYGRFIVNRHCAFQIDWLAKTGKPHIQVELDGMLAIVRTLPDECVVIDAGANIGLVSVPVAQAVAPKGGVVHAFEVQRPLLYALCGTAALNDLPNLHGHLVGLGAAQSVLTVPPVDYGKAQDFGIISLVDDAVGESDETIPITTLDSLDLHRLDFLKIDVEGMEVDVLRGARRTIETFQPWVWIEYWKSGVEEIQQELHGLDYKYFILDELNMLCAPRSRRDGVPIPATAVEI